MMVKKSETMGDKLRAMAAAVDAMDKEMAKLEQLSAYYSMMVVSLQKVTTQLSDAYESTDAGEVYAGPEIREAAAILREAAPPLKEWAETMLETWKKPAPSATRRGLMAKKIDPSDVEWNAKYRVEHSPRLRQYADIIFQDWDEYDVHLRWVVRARASEIESWAKSIANGITKGEGE